VNAPLTVSGLISSGAGRYMNIGTDCSGITIGKVGIETTLNGPLTVSGAITSGSGRNITIGSANSPIIYVTSGVSGTGNITSAAHEHHVKTRSLGFDCAQYGYDRIDINFLTDQANPTVASSNILAIGGTGTALQGTLQFSASNVQINGNFTYNKPSYATSTTSTSTIILANIGSWYDVGNRYPNASGNQNLSIIYDVYVANTGIYLISWNVTLGFNGAPLNNAFRLHITIPGVTDGYWAVNEYYYKNQSGNYFSGTTVAHITNVAHGIGCFVDSGNTTNCIFFTTQFKFRITRIA
jgi:hypothetical protein